MSSVKQILKEIRLLKPVHHLHTLYVVLALIVYASTAVGTDSTSKEITLIILFGAYSSILLFLFIQYIYKNSRLLRYANAIECLHNAIHTARDSYFQISIANKTALSNEEEDIRRPLVALLTSSAKAFSMVSGTPCRMSIKLIGKPDNSEDEAEWFVKTLARDFESDNKCREYDYNNDFVHLLKDNTDYMLLLNRTTNYYFKHDLSSISEDDHYQNSHLKYAKQIGSEALSNKWLLPYKATIVWPIRYVYPTNSKKSTEKPDQALYGFLTVDSNSSNVFNRRYDFHMGALLADALFPILHSYAVQKAGIKPN